MGTARVAPRVCDARKRTLATGAATDVKAPHKLDAPVMRDEIVGPTASATSRAASRTSREKSLPLMESRV